MDDWDCDTIMWDTGALEHGHCKKTKYTSLIGRSLVILVSVVVCLMGGWD